MDHIGERDNATSMVIGPSHLRSVEVANAPRSGYENGDRVDDVDEVVSDMNEDEAEHDSCSDNSLSNGSEDGGGEDESEDEGGDNESEDGGGEDESKGAGGDNIESKDEGGEDDSEDEGGEDGGEDKSHQIFEHGVEERTASDEVGELGIKTSMDAEIELDGGTKSDHTQESSSAPQNVNEDSGSRLVRSLLPSLYHISLTLLYLFMRTPDAIRHSMA